MSRYVLGLRKAGGQTDHATSHQTAAKTVEEVTAWRAAGGAVTVILRAGKPIDDRLLLRDAEAEERSVARRGQPKRRQSIIQEH